MIDDIKIDNLLYSSESDWLDFKTEQYPLDEKHEKAEFIKDILAFANSHRQSDAYILLGVKENGHEKAEVVGIEKHHDDSSLQQLVNSNTQRPVQFNYISKSYEGKAIGIIFIPIQSKRPYFLKSDYLPLKRNTVYIRRGSSTAIVDPDEIASMGVGIGILQKPEIILDGRIAVWGNSNNAIDNAFSITVQNHSTIDVMLQDIRLKFKGNMSFLFPYDIRHERNYIGELKPGYSATRIINPQEIMKNKKVNIADFEGVFILDAIGRVYENYSKSIVECFRIAIKSDSP